MTPNIRLIQHGEPLTPAVANRPIEDLIQWVSRLSHLVEAYTEMSNNMIHDQPVDDTVWVGAPVYLDANTGRYSRARVTSSVEMDRAVAGPESYVIGIVARKTSANTADICVGGVVEIDFAENGSNQDAFEEYNSLGVRYLSAAIDSDGLGGHVTTTAPAIVIPVAFVLQLPAAGKAVIDVKINLDRIMSGHRHYRLPMIAKEATSAAVEGWLAATDGSFMGMDIPVGAAYGYNLNASYIKEHFPIIIPDAFKLFWSQYQSDTGPKLFISEIYDDLYVVNSDGIWWLDATRPPFNGPEHEQMLAYYTNITYNTDDGVVTSLQAPAESGLEITHAKNGLPAVRGDLKLDLRLQNKVATEEFMGARTLKYIGDGYMGAVCPEDIGTGEEVNGGFFFGPTVESIETDSIFTAVESLDCLYTHDNRPTGRIMIRTNDAWSKIPLPVQSVHLDQMRDASIGGMVAITFPPNIKSGFSGQINLPRFNQEKATCRIRFTLVGGAAGDVSDLMFTGRQLVIPPAPCNAAEALPLPMTIPSLCNPEGDDVELKFDFDTNIPQAQMYFTICSRAIEVEPESLLWFSWHKEAGADYQGPLSVIKMEAYLDPIEAEESP